MLIFNPLSGQFDEVGVQSLSKSGSTALQGPVTLSAGSNITLTQTGQDISIAASGSTSPLTTKGDIYTFSTVDARLPVGTDGQVLSADSTQLTGLKWIASGGTGTVTSVGVSGANGIGVTGSPITTSGTIALSLGNITPTTVNGITLSGLSTPTLTVTGTSSISGSNTGDQTITLTGDVTGSGTGSFATTLATVNSNVGSFTNASVTVNAKGLITAVSSGTGVGDVVGPASSTNNAITRYNGTTGKLIQNSGATLDNNANATFNNYLGGATATVSAGGTTVLTAASTRFQSLTGSSSQTYQLPDATTLSLGPWFIFNNNSSGSLIITNAGTTTLYTVPAGGIVQCGPTNISTANGAWDFHGYYPGTVTWGSGTTGLVFNTALTTTPSINAGISSASNPSFIPQRGSSTTGYGGDSTHLYGSIGGAATFTSTATAFNIASGSQYQINGTQIAASNLSNGTTGTGSVVLATSPTIITPRISSIVTAAGNIDISPNSAKTTINGATANYALNVAGTGLNARMQFQGSATDNPGVEFTNDTTGTRRTLIRLNESGASGTELQFYTRPDAGGAVSNYMTLKSTGDLQLTTPGNNSGSTVTTDGTQTLTNKTITSPVIRSWDGWEDANETWTYASGTGTNVGTFTIAGVDLTSKYQAGDRVKFTQTTVKYGIITKVAFSTDTTVTIYMGTDYTIANAAISSNYYSKVKSPQGFPLSSAKWAEVTVNTSNCSKATPTGNVWYGDTGLSATGPSLVFPIGSWNWNYAATAEGTRSVASMNVRTTLSTTSSSESDANNTCYAAVTTGATNLAEVMYRSGTIDVTSPTTYYLNVGTTAGSSATNVALRGDLAPTIIRAVCAYL